MLFLPFVSDDGLTVMVGQHPNTTLWILNESSGVVSARAGRDDQDVAGLTSRVDVGPARLSVGCGVVVFACAKAAQERIAQGVVIARVRLVSNPSRHVAVSRDVIQVCLINHNGA